ncbi:sugar ABC transporter ATP-binding protein [Agrococcus sediminis]|uniref:sugar ABC transporter ATP-binding protein n=1 Tax=Agrococcus TaxID=46352 RepID=UPI001FF1112F|nr:MULTISPECIES: sugar ABC transporter ATP-binding protein [unclassified Agrococcus]MDR7233618.1 simple sugar transport system ATP-binding protein [Agrococcus sp. BE272]UOW01858.1 sugar ABC transporter ATP-binding protein [Agrococcus sp. SCSIO52902]
METDAAGADVPALALANLTKRFGPTEVLKGVDLALHSGRVTALLGANGAGKSTLIKVLAGVHAPSGGDVMLAGAPVSLDSPASASRLGIRTVHQRIDDAIVPGLSVAENLVFEAIAQGTTSRFGSLRSILPKAREVAGTLDLDWSDAFLRQDVHELGIADCQMLLLARALATTPKVLILDEPTSTLSKSEADRLFELVRALRDRGVAILYVSHRLGEVRALADDIAVLRDGRIVDRQHRPVDLDRAVTAMLGEGVIHDQEAIDELQGTEVALELRDLQVLAEGPTIDLELCRGEVTGIIGLVGAGKTELAEHLFGVRQVRPGTMLLHGKSFAPRSPKAAIRHGVHLVPEDRAAHGMLPGWSLTRTFTLPFLRTFERGIVMQRSREATGAKQAIAEFGIVTSGPEQAVDALSGGNQQKVMVARWMQRRPEILVLDEPFRGVDIGARREIAKRARGQAADGSCVVMICSDVEEVREMADRIVVMVEGRITLDARASAVRNEDIVKSMTEVVQ